MGSTKVTAEKMARTIASAAPTTLPMQAYGPQPIEWFDKPRPVWAWVQWRDQPATRVAAFAQGANDRVVMLEVVVGHDRWQPVVWRSAVTVRKGR